MDDIDLDNLEFVPWNLSQELTSSQADANADTDLSQLMEGSQRGTNNSRLRNWCITLNNPTEEEITSMRSCLATHSQFRYMVYQIESGENGTRHIQAYLELLSPIRLETLKKISPLQRAHLEPRRGTQQQAIDYCQKSETRLEGPWEIGIRATESQGHRRDLDEVRQLLISHTPLREIWDQHFATMVRYHRGVNVYRSLITPPRSWKTTVTYLYGEPGTGKSKWCLDNHPQAYWKQRGNWWDNYDGEDAVIIDDYYGWLPFDTLLRLCDRYPLLVESKGGNLNFTSRHICITSNTLPSHWYRNISNIEALYRRIDKYMIFADQVYEFNTFNEFNNFFN